MFDDRDKRMLPYQCILAGALGLYLWRLGRADGGTRVTIDTDKLASAAMPFIPVHPNTAPAVRQGIKKTLDVVLAKVKR